MFTAVCAPRNRSTRSCAEPGGVVNTSVSPTAWIRASAGVSEITGGLSSGMTMRMHAPLAPASRADAQQSRQVVDIREFLEPPYGLADVPRPLSGQHVARQSRELRDALRPGQRVLRGTLGMRDVTDVVATIHRLDVDHGPIHCGGGPVQLGVADHPDAARQ